MSRAASLLAAPADAAAALAGGACGVGKVRAACDLIRNLMMMLSLLFFQKQNFACRHIPVWARYSPLCLYDDELGRVTMPLS